MMYLLISIVLNAYLGVAFSIFHRYEVDLFQTIVFNYWACVITGYFVLGEFPVHSQTWHEPWFLLAMLMGLMFIMVFNLIARSSIKVGVTVTQTANKLSFCIPVVVSFIAYGEEVTRIKIVGIITALIAVILTTRKSSDVDQQSAHHNGCNSSCRDSGNTALPNPSEGETFKHRLSLGYTKKPLLRRVWRGWWTCDNLNRPHHNNSEYLLPIVLFFGSGLIDTITKFAQRSYLKDDQMANAYLISGFMWAALIGSVVLVFQYITGKRRFKWRNVVAGIILGFPNYFSIYYLVKALSLPALNSSATIPINNIGILFLVSLFGIFILKEKLNRQNYVGLALTLLAILLIYIGD